MTKKKVAFLPGDGIGQEVAAQAERVLLAVAAKYGLEIELVQGLVGGTAYDETGTPLPDETLKLCLESDAVMLGAVGGPKWEPLDFSVRPERGLLKLRSEMELFANLRPAVIYGDLVGASSLKEEIVAGADIMVVRELTGGIYFGDPRGVETNNGVRRGYNTLVYDENEIKRIAKVAFEIAQLRNKKMCSVDKANVLEVTELWRDVVTEMSPQYPDVELSHMYVDNAAMQLVRAPKQFDTIVTGNLFGDILSDAAAMITGSLGMLPSASIGEKYAMYEPVHGSAPDIAGQDLANPLATILSIAMMFKYSFKMTEASDEIEKAVVKVLEENRTADVWVEGKKKVGCVEMGDLVMQALS